MKTLEAPAASVALPSVSAETVRLAVNSRFLDHVELVKPRLSLMVLFTVAVGFLLASPASIHAALLVHTLIGTALVAAGASALNQLAERDVDRLMRRTRNRPLPAGRLQPAEALRFGVLTACAGFAYLAILVNPLTSLLGVLTLACYVFVYTPLKRRSTMNTLVGAVAGALPPLMGWAAATGGLAAGAVCLFLILFLWQLPHFWAIAWIHREDYARAGLRMVPVLDRQGGKLTGRLMVQHSFLLLLASLGPAMIGLAGPRYVLAAVVLGGLFACSSWAFLMQPENERGRYVLWASLVYLPLLLTLLVLDGMTAGWGAS
jgi:protoheme IX farnesyltransferase